jgi:hypothetical protein
VEGAKYKVLVVVESDSGRLDEAGRELAKGLESEPCDTKVRASSAAVVSDVLWADVVLLGYDDEKSLGQTGFKELNRAFRGINLAGRTAGLFHVTAAEAPALLRRMLKDTDIALFPEILSAVAGRDVAVWVRAVVRSHREMIDARHR